MKTAEELMPGGRWLSTPGTNFDSAAYALAIGTLTSKTNRRLLDWSEFTKERLTYDAVKPSCNFEMVAWMKREGVIFEPQRPMEATSLVAVVKSWNVRMQPKIKVHVSCDGQDIVEPSGDHDGYKSVYVRHIGVRWEVYGYFQQSDPNPSSLPATRTLSAITSIETEPLIAIDEAVDAQVPTAALTPTSWASQSLDSMVTCLRTSSQSSLPLIKNIYLWLEVMDVSRFEALRPPVGRLCSELVTVMSTGVGIMNTITNSATNQEMGMFLTKLGDDARQKDAEKVMQKKDEATKEKGDGDVEQRKRKEAEAAAAAYAAQDRYDSCSDSD